MDFYISPHRLEGEIMIIIFDARYEQNHNKFTKTSFKEAHILLKGESSSVYEFPWSHLADSLQMYRRVKD